MEKAKIALLEVCFALAIFREEFNAHLIILFTAVLFCKIFHWLCMARFELVSERRHARPSVILYFDFFSVFLLSLSLCSLSNKRYHQDNNAGCLLWLSCL